MSANINSNNLNDLLGIVKQEIEENRLSLEHLRDREIIETLTIAPQPTGIDENLLRDILGAVLAFPTNFSVRMALACKPHFSNQEEFFQMVWRVANNMAYERRIPEYAADLLETIADIKPDSIELFNGLVWFNISAKRFQKAISWSGKFLEAFQDLEIKALASYCYLYSLIDSGAWLDALEAEKIHRQLLESLCESAIIPTHPLIKTSLPGFVLPLVYMRDQAQENRKFQNDLSNLFEKLVLSELVERRNDRNLNRPLKIGYVGHTLRRHSVGWLSRWLIHYHDRENFKIHLYLVHQLNDSLTETYFMKPEDKTYNFQRNPLQVAQQIQADGIDILVDLDSITSNLTCQVMAMKPAPIQVTWLGYDASGIPAVDYFIADNYSLPENAQDYYREKIWRLPHSYLSVDGFEVGIPNLRRDKLGIPEDGIIYLSSQTGLKRHPDTIRSQMRILAGVPNSYLLVKGLGDSQTIQAMFRDIALEEGVSPERLRFLAIEASEEIHRANLSIADVVLDTYPYGGATTTLEVLWMGIPLVTRVGQQFPARNSYTFMVNAGISEGITWSEAEYVEWGIKLGTDAELRQQVREKLRLSKKLSPLWNARRFTLDVESAYREMWREYCS